MGMTVSTVNLVQARCRAINLPGNHGPHRSRRTFGYLPRVRCGVGAKPHTSLDNLTPAEAY